MFRPWTCQSRTAGAECPSWGHGRSWGAGTGWKIAWVKAGCPWCGGRSTFVLGRWVAVKVLSRGYADDDHFRQTIHAEALAAAKVSHPHLASVYDYGESPDEGRTVPYIVMELLEGPTLLQRLASGPLPPRAGLRICTEVAEALTHAHAHHLVHCDVKPGNIVLTADGAKLVDFGIAAAAGTPDASGPDGNIMGTPSYVAPERLLGGAILPASDVYALGVLVFRVLTGGLPWPAGTPSLSARAEPALLPDLDGVPAEIGDLCRRCVAFDPDDRPTALSAATILAASVGVRPVMVEGDLGDETTDPSVGVAGPVTDPSPASGDLIGAGRPPVRNRAIPFVITIAAAAAAALLVLNNLNGSAQEPPPFGAGVGRPTVAAPGLSETPPPGAPGGAPTGQAGQPGAPMPSGVWPSGQGVPWPSTIPGGPSSPVVTITGPGPPPPAPTTGAGARMFVSRGGSALVTCSGSLAYLESWSPAGGYSVAQPPHRGPDTTAWITFEKHSSEATITAWCTGGQPQGRASATKPPKPTKTAERGD